ncbi:MAG TPA: hypothetical protein VG273_27135 [Bryobacteraceae bacterium]|nr:hypothetical protein [Bryobacteraceae bacterium]
MRALALFAFFCSFAFADTIYPTPPQPPPGASAGGYMTLGITDGIPWAAIWYPDGVNQSVWVAGFAAPISAYTLTLNFGDLGGDSNPNNGAYVPALWGTLETSTWLSINVQQLSGSAPQPESDFLVAVGGPGSPPINFTRLQAESVPEPGSVWLCGPAITILLGHAASRRRRKAWQSARGAG